MVRSSESLVAAKLMVSNGIPIHDVKGEFFFKQYACVWENVEGKPYLCYMFSLHIESNENLSMLNSHGFY